MSAPQAIRPLRAILQRRLQIVPSRPIRTPFFSRAPQTAPQLRFNSSIPPNETTQPDQKATKDEANKAEAASAEPPVEQADHAAKPTPTETGKSEPVLEAEVQAHPEILAAPEAPAAAPAASTLETTSAAPSQPPVRRLDEVFPRSAFQQVRSADEEIQAGIQAVLTLQLEPATVAAPTPVESAAPKEAEPAVEKVEKLVQEAPQETQQVSEADATISEKASAAAAPQATKTPEPSLAEVAEAVFAETETVAIPQQPSAQEPSVPAAEAAEAASTEVTATGAASPAVSASTNESEFVKPREQEVTSDEATRTPVAESETPASSDGIDSFSQKVLDDIAAEAAEAMGASARGETPSQDDFVEAVLKERTKASEPPKAPESKKTAKTKGMSKKDNNFTLLSAVDKELLRRKTEIQEAAEEAEAELKPGEEPSRMPRNVQALYLQPLRRIAKHGVPSCDLQLRSYSVRPLESFCDFALRAAYYCGLPAYGPVPLPKIIERWTVPKSSFIFKKSQENFERITRRRLIQIRDGHPQTVQMWLAFLQKHQQAAVGMKANMWEFSSIDVAKEMDKAYEQAQKDVDKSLHYLGQVKAIETAEKVDEILHSERYRMASGR